jgi:uncharacterized membrane protein YgdD (TMEM256/DUF423 family)
MNILLLLGAALGLTSVMMAAFVDHSILLHANPQLLASVLTAVRYHQYYALMIVVLALQPQAWLRRTCLIFILGTVFFSGGIYLSTFLDVHNLIYFTPVGGMTLMLGWGSLILSAFQSSCSLRTKQTL